MAAAKSSKPAVPAAAPNPAAGEGGKPKAPKGRPRPKGKPAGTRKAAASGKASGKPTPGLDIPMVWLALGSDIPGTWSLQGVTFYWPKVDRDVRKVSGPNTTDNVILVPRPKTLAESAEKNFPLCKVASGRLPNLTLWDAFAAPDYDTRKKQEAANEEIWRTYLADHSPATLRIADKEGWLGKITVKRKA